MTAEARQFREQLLAKSLVYAVENVPFYSELPHLRGKGSTLSLEDFPILEKEQIAANLWQFLVLDRFPDYLISSGGTTPGYPSITFRNEEEYQAAHHYLNGQYAGQYPSLDQIDEFVLDIFFNTNGYSWRKAPGWPALSIRLERLADAEIIKRCITEGLIVNGRQIPARRIECQNGPLRSLTGHYWVEGFLPRNNEIKSVYGYGSHISRVWRKRLKEVWGVDVLTSYGLSEFAIGNARQCFACGSYHFWTSWPEFFSLNLNGPVESGDAVLVLTTLVPFTQVQPRVRYLTNDLVTVTGYCELAGQLGFRFRGRASSSVVARMNEKYEVLFSEVEMVEVLDQLPDVGCQIHYCEQQLWSESNNPPPPFRLGAPKFQIESPLLETKPEMVRIYIETSFDPLSDTLRAQRFREKFTETLFADYPHVARRLHDLDTKIDVQLLPPGTSRLRVKGAG